MTIELWEASVKRISHSNSVRYTESVQLAHFMGSSAGTVAILG